MIPEIRGSITVENEINGSILENAMRGYSPYELAKRNGFVGTEEEWLASLKGDKGDIGLTPDISIGNVTTGQPGTNVEVSVSGTPENPVMDFTIPRGDVGATPNMTIGTVATGQEGTQAQATITGTPENPVLNLTIPRGDTGDAGFDPVVEVTKDGNTATVSVTDATHTTEVNIIDGYTPQKNVDYFDGHSPKITGAKSQGTTFIYSDGEQIGTIADGQDGYTPRKGVDYFDGHTPAISGEKIDDTTFIYADGVRIATVLDGIDGNSPVITTVKSGKTTSILADSVVIGTVSDGADGHTPTITTTKSGKTTTIFADGTSIGTISDGQDGHSPEITTNKVGKVLSILSDGQIIGTVSDGSDGQDAVTPTITTDKSGTTTTIYSNGVAIGTVEDGADGTTPVITATKSEGITTIKANGVDIATINDGTSGEDGYSPTASVSKSSGVSTLTVTDESGTTSVQISDGTGMIASDPNNDGNIVLTSMVGVQVDTEPTQGSTNTISSGGVYNELTDVRSDLQQICDEHVSINLYDKNACNPQDGKSYWGGVLSSSTVYATTGKIPVEENTQYIFHAGTVTVQYVEYYSGDAGETYISRETVSNAAFTTPLNCTYIAVMIFATSHTTEQYNAAIAVAQLEKGNTVHPYEPYGSEFSVLLSAIKDGDKLSKFVEIAKSASASDIGRPLTPKTVENGVVTEWQYLAGSEASVEEIVDEITEERASTNLYDANACNPEDGHLYWNGVYNAGEYYATTGKIPVEEGTQYIYYAGGKVVLYVEYFSGESGSTFISRETVNGAAFTTPENCTYVAVMLFGASHTTADYNEAIAAGQLNIGDVVLPYEPFGATHYVPLDAVENGSELLGISVIPTSKSQINLYDKTLAVNGKYWNKGATEMSSSDWAHTGKIPVKPNTQYNISKAVDSPLTLVSAVYAYDSTGAYLRTESLSNYIYSALLSFTTDSDVYFVSVNMTLAGHTEADFNNTIDTIMMCYGTQRPKTYASYNVESVIPHDRLDDYYMANRDCFTGKRWLATGTSITWYDSKAYQAGVNTGELCRGYVGNVARRKHLLVTNEGISGSTLGNVSESSLINRYQSLDWEHADIATIEYGVNDLGNNVTVGTAEDAAGNSTFAACLKTVIEYALSENPKICLVICTEPDVRGTNTNNNGNTLKDYSDVTIAIAQQYRLPVCDWYYSSGINALNKGDTTKDWMTADGTHPNDDGHMRMGAMLNQLFDSLIC